MAQIVYITLLSNVLVFIFILSILRMHMCFKIHINILIATFI